jgi:hypothetical protein
VFLEFWNTLNSGSLTGWGVFSLSGSSIEGNSSDNVQQNLLPRLSFLRREQSYRQFHQGLWLIPEEKGQLGVLVSWLYMHNNPFYLMCGQNSWSIPTRHLLPHNPDQWL